MRVNKSMVVLSTCLIVVAMSGFIGGSIIWANHDSHNTERAILFFQDFNSGNFSKFVWAPNSEWSYTFEEDPHGGLWLHTRVTGSEAREHTPFYFVTIQTFDAPYIVEFDFMQPGGERGTGSTYIGQYRPESLFGLFYWYLEFMPSQGITVQVYTENGTADSNWDVRWMSDPNVIRFEPDTLYRFKVENEATKTRITVYSSTGEQLVQSPWLAHDSGSAGNLAIGAYVKRGETRGAIFDNIKVYAPW